MSALYVKQHRNERFPHSIVSCQKVFKHLIDSSHQGTGDLERQEKPEVYDCTFYELAKSKRPQKIVEDFNCAEDGEASEKAHRATYQAKLGFECHLSV